MIVRHNHLISIISLLIIFNEDNPIIIHRDKQFEEQIISKLNHDLK
ncbi:unnamed protein product, partial [Rotaria sp. Silwood1]